MRTAKGLIGLYLALAGLTAGMLATAAPASANNPAVCEVSHFAFYSDGVTQRAHSVSRGTDCTLRQPANWYAATDWWLEKEDSGVYALQMALRHCHGQNIAVDGFFGSATTQALKNAQASVGATPDGILGPRTNSKMRWMRTGYTFPCTAGAQPPRTPLDTGK